MEKRTMAEHRRMKPHPPVLYRFSQRQFLEQTRARGIVRFAHARTFRDSTLAAAQADNEQARSFYLDPASHQVLASRPASEVEPITDLSYVKFTLNLVDRTGRPLDYYLLCFSLVHAPRFYAEFHADACLCIRDPKTFSERLEKVCRTRFPGCDFYGRDCFYYDPNRFPPTIEQKHLAFAKDVAYGWQQEFRFILAMDPDLSREDYLFFEVGPLENISEFCTAP